MASGRNWPKVWDVLMCVFVCKCACICTYVYIFLKKLHPPFFFFLLVSSHPMQASFSDEDNEKVQCLTYGIISTT